MQIAFRLPFIVFAFKRIIERKGGFKKLPEFNSMEFLMRLA